MAKQSGIYWGIGILGTMLLTYAAGAVIAAVTGMSWFDRAGWALPLAILVPLAGASYWLGRGGAGPTVAGPVMVRLYSAAFAFPVLVHRGICWVRSIMGPRRDLFRGVVHLRQARLEGSAAALRWHLRRNPEDTAGLICATMALAKLRRHDEALRFLDAAATGKNRADALGLRALALASVGASEDALRDIDAAVALRPKNPIYHFWRTLILVVSGSVDQALDALKGPAHPKKCPFNWWPLSLALMRKGDAAAADASCRAVYFLQTMSVLHPMPWDEGPKADILARMGKLDQAQRAFARTLTRNPGDDEALAVKALVHARRGETEDALRALEEAGRRNPFLVVDAARDPLFAPLVASPGFPPLLERATQDWEARLFAIRHRPGIAQSGA
jgi:tetratricopeptide (TPR) repeat protein